MLRLVIPVAGFLGLAPVFAVAAGLEVKTNVNTFGETTVTTRSNGAPVREDVTLKSKRPLRFSIPDVPAFELVLRFPDGRVISEAYTRRALVSRTRTLASGTRVVDRFTGGRRTSESFLYKDGQETTVHFDGAGGKEREFVRFKDGATEETWFDARGDKLRVLAKVPLGDETTETYRGARLTGRTVRSPKGDVSESEFDARGRETGRVERPATGWKRRVALADGKQVAIRYFAATGLELEYRPGYRRTDAVDAFLSPARAATNTFHLRPLEDAAFEEDVVAALATNAVACLPASNLVFRVLVAPDRPLLVERWARYKVYARMTYAYDGSRETSRTAEEFNADGKLVRSLVTRADGRLDETRWERELVIRVVTEKGVKTFESRVNRVNGSSVEEHYAGGRLARRTFLDRESHIRKLVQEFSGGTMTAKTEHFAAGYSYRYEFGKDGKTRIYKRPWNPEEDR